MIVLVVKNTKEIEYGQRITISVATCTSTELFTSPFLVPLSSKSIYYIYFIYDIHLKLLD